MGDWPAADEISLAYALSSWKPTQGTRDTIQASKQRRGGRRLVFASGKLEHRTDSAPVSEWTFPEPIGRQAVVGEFLTADSVTISRHVQVPEIRTYMTLAPLGDLSDPDLSPPPEVDESGRSAQTFLIEAVVRRGDRERRSVVSGQDIYAVTAPLLVEAMERVLALPLGTAGVFAAGEIFPALEFLRALHPEPLRLELREDG